MSKQKKGFVLCMVAAAVMLVVSLLLPTTPKTETVQEAMRDAVLHESNRIDLFGKEVNPGLISAMTVSGILLVVAACLRIFVIPRFQYVPGRLQLLLEELVGLFDRMAKSNSPERNGFLGAYIFGAGVYIFTGTIFELFGLQAVTTQGHSIALPAPLSDINAAIALGCLSYLVILSGGVASNGMRGVGRTLKEFSLPLSMSLRLFRALLTALPVTELVYYLPAPISPRPVGVGALSAALHPRTQTSALVPLTSLFYGEVSEHSASEGKKSKKQKTPQAQNA